MSSSDDENNPSALKARALEACKEFKEKVIKCMDSPFASGFCAQEMKDFLECYKAQRGDLKAKLFGRQFHLSEYLDSDSNNSNTPQVNAGTKEENNNSKNDSNNNNVDEELLRD
eukprot:m.241674 g.241674  ORF g.241674 m.241674 type:complete len:114 (+) comp25268_c0_seq1:57-398(+)